MAGAILGMFANFRTLDLLSARSIAILLAGLLIFQAIKGFIRITYNTYFHP